jgi:hypothetical protein
MPIENNIKWHIGHTVDLYSYAGGKNLKYRINILSFLISCACAVLDEEKKPKIQHDVKILSGMRAILRTSYFPALENNAYIPHIRANFEMAMDIVEMKMMKIINRHNLASSAMMQEAMTSLGNDRRARLMKGGDAQ